MIFYIYGFFDMLYRMEMVPEAREALNEGLTMMQFSLVDLIV